MEYNESKQLLKSFYDFIGTMLSCTFIFVAPFILLTWLVITVTNLM